MAKQIMSLLFIFFSSITAAQTSPKKFKEYISDHSFPYGIEHLILSSDYTFFYANSSESGNVYVGRGSWKMKNNKLYLSGWDSSKAYPKPHLTFNDKIQSKELLITAKDYFHKPYKSLALELIRVEDSTNRYTEMIFADSLGQFRISKSLYKCFDFVYQMINSEASNVDTIQVYCWDKDVSKIDIYINFASEGGLDRGIDLINYGNRVYKLKKGKLYNKKKVEFKEQNL